MADDQTLQLVLEAVNNMSAAMGAATDAIDAVAKAADALDGKKIAVEVDVDPLEEAIAKVKELAAETETIGDASTSVTSVFTQAFSGALNPVNLLTGALGVLGGNLMTNIVTGFMDMVNPLNLL
ncbi:MAG: hypothetical protein ABFD77_01225, partial [Thermotogota bacterium]